MREGGSGENSESGARDESGRIYMESKHLKMKMVFWSMAETIYGLVENEA